MQRQKKLVKNSQTSEKKMYFYALKIRMVRNVCFQEVFE
jgi:hypothetical protein